MFMLVYTSTIINTNMCSRMARPFSRAGFTPTVQELNNKIKPRNSENIRGPNSTTTFDKKCISPSPKRKNLGYATVNNIIYGV